MYIGSIRPSLLLAALHLCLSAVTVCAGARAASAQRVELVQSLEMDWPEGRRGAQDELLASGYRVTDRSSGALDVGVLLEELATTERADDIVARVTVLRLGRTGIAYVWLEGSGETYRVTSGDPDPIRAANILSLRVVELIDLRGEGLEGEAVSAPPAGEPEGASAESWPADPQSAGDWRILAGGGLSRSSGLRSSLTSAELIVGRRIAGLVGAEGSFSLGLNHPSRDFEATTVRVGRQRGALGVFVSSGVPLWWQAGASLGLECHQFAWTGTSSTDARVRSACAPSSAVFGRSGVRWRDATLWISGSVSLGHRAVRLIDSGTVLASYGRPTATLSGGVGWMF